MSKTKKLIVGLDIGTSKVAVVAGAMTPEGMVEIVGVGSHPSRGMKKGEIVNMDAVGQSVLRAFNEAELMAGSKFDSVFTGMTGSHIRSFNSNGVVAIRDQEVTSQDVDRVREAAKAVAIPADQKTLHVLDQEFIIDGQAGIVEPIGMSGVRLEARVHIVTGAVSAAQNIVTCVRRCGLEVEDIILEQIASSQAVLTEDEKQLGVCLIDIGGGTTDIAVFSEGAIRHTAVIPIAGDQVSNDIAVALRTPSQSAENIKIQYGCALTQMANMDEIIEIPNIGASATRRLSRVTLAEVIEPRFEELFSLVQSELRRNGIEGNLSAGIVITGGSARMEGLVELAETIFNVPVRLGIPRVTSGLVEVVKNPIYATSVGLMLYGLHTQHQRRIELISNHSFKGFLTRMKTWFQGNF